jgi:serine/threonine protein kinase
LKDLLYLSHRSIYIATCIDADLIDRTERHAVVVKNVDENLEWMQEKLKRAFFQELTLMWRFRSHPNFVKVYAYSTKPVCLLMKYYEAGDLSAYCRGRGRARMMLPYSVLRITRMLGQFCAGIAYMHSNGIAHCDVKPANVLLEYSSIYGEWMMIITDFGIARVLDQAKAGVDGFQVSELRGASIAYSSPDVLIRLKNSLNEKNPSVWKAGDAYSLAVCICELLKRRSPWHVSK